MQRNTVWVKKQEGSVVICMSMREQAELDYMAGMKYKDIAAKYGVSINTVKSWKVRHGWDRNASTAPKKKKPKKVHTKKRTQKAEQEDERQDEKRKAMKALVKVDWMQEKQKMFCLYYMQTHNATSSYQRAYGCTRAAAAASGCRLLNDAKVRECIQRLQDDRDAGMLLRATDVVDLYMRIAFADLEEFVEVQDGKYSVRDIAEVDSQLIDSVTLTKTGKVIVKLADRMKALKWLSDYFELNPNDKHRASYQSKMVELREREIRSKEEGW